MLAQFVAAVRLEDRCPAIHITPWSSLKHQLADLRRPPAHDVHGRPGKEDKVVESYYKAARLFGKAEGW
jgi:hypothetical protein